jgi:hypothetical protein
MEPTLADTIRRARALLPEIAAMAERASVLLVQSADARTRSMQLRDRVWRERQERQQRDRRP